MLDLLCSIIGVEPDVPDYRLIKADIKDDLYNCCVYEVMIENLEDISGRYYLRMNKDDTYVSGVAKVIRKQMTEDEKQNDKLYFSYFTGVYRYNSDRNILEQIADAVDQKYLGDMYGRLAVNSKEEIFILVFNGGGDDEGPLDFLYMTPERE